jgi:hypothetical protein
MMQLLHPPLMQSLPAAAACVCVSIATRQLFILYRSLRIDSRLVSIDVYIACQYTPWTILALTGDRSAPVIDSMPVIDQRR